MCKLSYRKKYLNSILIGEIKFSCYKKIVIYLIKWAMNSIETYMSKFYKNKIIDFISL